MKPTRPVLLLLGRPDCQLCEEFRDALEEAFPGRYDVQEACVDDRADWRERFGTRIPVLMTPDGRVLCTTWFDPDVLE
jgi:hypothetical protein